MDVFTRALSSRPRSAALGDRCDFCAAPIDEQHSHLVDMRDRRLLCSCRPCYLVFLPDGAAKGRYRAVPERVACVEDGTVAPELWDAFQIPIGLAFFFFNSNEQKVVAFYPGPAGATESLLALESWQALAEALPSIASMQDDVEALLVRRERGRDEEYFIVPIDACYELVGIMRSAWKGFDGGQEARDRIDAFFAGLHLRSGGVRAPVPP